MNAGEKTTGSGYWAFISYSHKDEKLAAWLHESLERYRVPKGLVGRATSVGTVPKRLYPIFRDRNELPSSSSLNEVILKSLSSSRNLILICSPHAVASRWVSEEVLAFKRLGRSARILCLIVDGEPNASDFPEAGLAEAFPSAVRFEVDSRGELTNRRAEPIAADARPGKDGRSAAKLKLVAGLLDLRLGELIERERRRRIRRNVQWAGVSALVAFVILGIWLNGRQNTLKEQERTNEQRRAAGALDLAKQAQASFPQPGGLPNSVLLGIEGMHRAASLGLSADEVYGVIRRGLALLPAGSTRRVEQTSKIRTGAYSRSSRWLATIDEARVRLWDAATAEPKAVFALRSDGVSLAFADDDRQLRTISHDAVQFWDIASQKELASPTFSGLSSEFWSQAVLSPTGTLLAGPGLPLTQLLIWDTATGKLLREITTARPVTTLAFSADDRFLMAGIAEQYMTGPGDPGAQLWEVATGKERGRWDQSTFVEAIVFSENGNFVAIGSGASIQVLKTDTAREVLRAAPPAAGNIQQRILSLALDAQGQWLAAGGPSEVNVWEVSTGRIVARISESGDVVAFSPDSKRLLMSSGSLWEMNTAEQRSRLMSSEDVLVQMTFGATNDRLAAGSQQGGAKIWEASTGRLISTLPSGPHTTIQAMSADGRYAATMSGVTLGSTRFLRLWDVGTGREIAKLEPGAPIISVVFSPSARHVAIGDQDGRVSIYTAENGNAGPSTHVGMAVRDLAFVRAGEALVITNEAGEVWWWNPLSNEKRSLPIGGKDKAITVSPDTRHLAVTVGTAVVLCDAMSASEISRKTFDTPVTSVSFSADNRHAAAVAGNTVYVWDIAAQTDITQISPAPQTNESKDSRVAKVAIAPDGQWLAIVWEEGRGEDYTVTVWHVPTRLKLATIVSHADQIAFSPDGQRLAVLTRAGTVTVDYWQAQQLIDAACARVSPASVEQVRKILDLQQDDPPICRPLIVRVRPSVN